MQGLSTPSVIVNGDKWRIVPNTFRYRSGSGNVSVRAASGGGGDIRTVHTVDAETKKSFVTFELYNVADNQDRIQVAKSLIGRNTIEAPNNLADGTSVALVFPNMSLTNDPEVALTADGRATLEFEGDPMFGAA
jgi:hypothetical protein